MSSDCSAAICEKRRALVVALVPRLTSWPYMVELFAKRDPIRLWCAARSRSSAIVTAEMRSHHCNGAPLITLAT